MAFLEPDSGVEPEVLLVRLSRWVVADPSEESELSVSSTVEG